MLTREAILNAQDLVTEAVPVPEWGGDGATVNVRRLTAGDFIALLAKVKEDPDRAYAWWIVYTVVDAQGQRLFTDDDADALACKSITVIERLVEAGQRLNLAKKDQAGKN